MMVPELQEDPEWIELADQYQVFRPEEGPLERRIGVSFEEALFLDENDEAYANQEHQDYWFTLPEEGWNQESKRVRRAEVLPGEWPNAEHFGEEDEKRIPIQDLKEGQVLRGTVIRTMLLHGAQIDIGATFDALVPIDTEGWTSLHWEVLSDRSTNVIPPGWQNPLPIGTQVQICIAQVVKEPMLYFCRFPVICELLSPQLNIEMLDPNKYEPKFDLRGLGSDVDHLNSITGRYDYKPGVHGLDVWPTLEQRFLDNKQLQMEAKYEVDYDGEAALSQATQRSFEEIIAEMQS